MKDTNNLHDAILQYAVDFYKMYNEILEIEFKESLKSVSPPIKGEITKGKIKWRSVRMIVQKMGNGIDRTWLAQRGVRISRIVEFNPLVGVSILDK